MEKHRVLVTGANGLLGSNTIEALLLHGYEVVAFVRKNANLVALSGLNCTIFKGDISNSKDIQQALKGCEFVIHSAARTEQFPSKLAAYQSINVDSTQLLVECCKLNSIKRFIYVSTANCFTNGTLLKPGNENSQFMPWLEKSGYAYSKYLAQQFILNEVKTNQFPAIVVAPTFLLGARDSKPSSGQLILHGLKKRIVFYPPGGKSFIDVSLAAQAIVNALAKGRNGECYLLAGENLSYKVFFKLVRKVSQKRQILIGIPRWLITVAGYLFSALENIFPISLPFNHTTQKLLCLPNYFSNHKATKELDLQHTKIDETLHKTILWFNTPT